MIFRIYRERNDRLLRLGCASCEQVGRPTAVNLATQEEVDGTVALTPEGRVCCRYRSPIMQPPGTDLR